MKKSSSLPITLKSEVVPSVAIIISFIAGLYFYSHFGPTVISHWNWHGTPDGVLPRVYGSFGMPVLILIIYGVFLVLPTLDPRKEQYVSFARAYHLIKGTVVLTLLVIFLATGAYNLGYPIDMGIIIPFVIGIMMILLGRLLGNIRGNWFIGFRTPWTLSNEKVWKKTNRLGGFMLVIFGALLIFIPFLPSMLGITAFILGILLVVIIPVVYSYILYKEEEKKK